MKKDSKVIQLFNSYLEDRYSDSDLKEILSYFEKDVVPEDLTILVKNELEKTLDSGDNVTLIVDNVKGRLFLSIKNKREIPSKNVSSRHRLLWIGGIAATILACLACWNWLKHTDAQIIQSNAYGYANDVLPVGKKATLILSNGRTVELNNDKTALTESDGTTIANEHGQLVYRDSGEEEKILTNTLIVPKGSSYELLLPDGSKVWLNASSSLRFPTRFNGAERRVYLTGEAYFQVAKNPKMPFIAQTGNTTVKALGTEFNINSDQFSNLKATLTEGSVMVSALGQSVKLIPGKQAIVRKAEKNIQVRDADLEQTTAWKDGYFYFKNDRLENIMNEISNWYDVELSYEGVVPNELYTGSIDRKANLSEVLEMLKPITSAKFEINKKNLIIKFKPNK